MGSQGPGRKRIPNRNGLTAEEDALNVIAREAEARLAAKRAARAEAREIRMKELERQQKEIYQVQKKYYGLDNLDNKWGDIEQWMENSERYTRHSRRHGLVSDDEEQMSVRSRSSLQLNLDSVGADGGLSQTSSLHSHKNSKKKKKHIYKNSNGYDDYSTISSQGSLYEDSFCSSSRRSSTQTQSEYSDVLGLSSRTSSRASSRCTSPMGSSQASALSTATLTSLGSCRGSGDSTVTANTETSMQEIKEIHELKDQIQDVESKYMQNLREVKDSLVEMEEKYRKAMVSNAQLDNEKTNLMYQVDTLKDSLIQLEELLAETHRESEDKSKHLEREKHAYSVLQFQFNELKETLKQSEELLTEIRQLQFKQDGFVREISDLQETIDWKNKKIGALERQKEYCDAIRNERDELRDEVVQLKDILKKHGIVLGPDLSTNKEAGEDVADGSGSAIKEGSSVLGPQEFQLGRDGNVKSYREDQDQKSKDLDHEMQNNLPHPHALSVAENNDGGLVNAFRSQNENSGVFESRGVISKSQFEDKVKTNDVVLQDLKDSVPLMKGTSTPDQVESSVSVKTNEVIKEESPESTNYACEVHLSSQENMGIAQDKNVFEGLTKIDKNAPCSQSVCSSSKKKKKKKKKKQKQSCEKKENSTAQQRESDPECISEFGEASEDVSVNENVKTNLNNEEKMDPENKDKLQSPTSKIDTVTRELSEAVSQNQQDLADCMTKSDFISAFNASKIKTDQDIPTDDFQKQITIGCVKASECDHLLDIPPSIGNIESKVMSNINDPFPVESSLCDIHSVCSSNMSSDCLGFHNSSSNIENPFVVKNEREISKKENYLVENKKDSQVIQLDETCVHEFQYDEVEKKLIKDENTTQGHITSTWPEDVQYGGDHNKKKAHLEVSGDSELNTIEEISLDTGVSVTPSVDKCYMDTTPVQRPVEEDEYQGHAYTLQGPKVVEHEIREECEESLEFHDMDLEASSGVIPQYVSVEQEKEVIWSKGKLHEDNEQQNGNRPQELIGGQSKDVDQVPEMDEQDSESHEGEEQTMDRDRCVTEEQQTVTEEQCGHEIQGITENDEARSKDHQELKDTESNAGANDESTKNLQDIDDPLLETEDLAMKSSVLLT